MTALSRPDRARVFLEERADLRLVLDSGGRRDVRVMTSRGVAFGGPSSFHVTDPTADEVRELLGDGSVPGSPPAGFTARWIEEREGPLRDLVTPPPGRAPASHRSVTMIAFNQTIWVAVADRKPRRDIRGGCRYEFVTEFESHPNSRAFAESADRPDATIPPLRALGWALERSDRKRRGLERARVGKTRAVFAPGVAGIVVHELVGHALEGDVVARGATWIQSAGLLEPQRAIRVIDDPRRGRGAWSLDDEGTDSQATTLVEAGRPVGLLLDIQAAARLGRYSTGHGRRSSHLDSVRPRMGCTFVAEGPDDSGAILRDTRSGVFIHRMTAGHTDPFEGRASFLVTEADIIDKGTLGSPLEPFVIELDAREAWASIDRIGRDLAFDTCVGSCLRDGQPMAVSVGAPTIRIGVVTVVS